MEWEKVFTKSELEKLKKKYDTKKARAAERKLEFSLSWDDWLMMGEKILGVGHCDYTNMRFSTRENGYNPCYPSIERIDDKKGYIPGNCCVVCRRANELKDNLIDKKSSILIQEPIDRDMVRAMLLNMSDYKIELLKKKYIFTEGKQVDNTNMQAEAENEWDSRELGADENFVEQASPEDTEAFHEAAKEVEEPELPEDVTVALAYAKYCKDFHEVGMKVSVTYAQFKAKYTRKLCAMSGEKLDKEPKDILILDLNIGFAKDNFVIVSEKMSKAMTNLMISTGMSLPTIFSMMKKVM